MTRLTITLADRTHRALKEAAVRQGRSMAAIIEESLEMRGIRPLDTAREIALPIVTPGSRAAVGNVFPQVRGGRCRSSAARANCRSHNGLHRSST